LRVCPGFAATVAYTAILVSAASLLDMQAGFLDGALYDATFRTQGANLERSYSAMAAPPPSD